MPLAYKYIYIKKKQKTLGRPRFDLGTSHTENQTLYQLSYGGLMENGFNFIDFKFIMPLGYIKNKQKARRARAQKRNARAQPKWADARAHARAHWPG